MKKKNGFTLVEIAISVTLLSVVMVFMIKFIAILRTDEDSIGLETDLILNKTIISRTIHEDIIGSNGISSLSCTNLKCTFSLKDGSSRSAEVINEGTTLVYKNITKNEILLSRKLPNNLVFVLSGSETTYLYMINIAVDSHTEHNIEIVNKKS